MKSPPLPAPDNLAGIGRAGNTLRVAALNTKTIQALGGELPDGGDTAA